MFNVVLDTLAREIRQEKSMKDIQIRKKDIILPLFADDMIYLDTYFFNVKNPKLCIQ